MSITKLSSDVLRQHKGISFPGVSTVFLCYDAQGRVFQAQRSKNARDEHGRWDFGGGGLKHGQTAVDNVVREMKEEYNFSPQKIDFIGYIDLLRTINSNESHWVILYFAVLVNPKELKINEPDKVNDYGWFSLDTLPTPQHSAMGTFLKKYGIKVRQVIAKNIT